MKTVGPGVVLAAVVVAALWLGLAEIENRSFWLDEGYSVSYARLPLGDLFDVAAEHQANMSLYYLLLHFWLAIGDGEFAIRSLSVLFAVATLPVVYGIGRRLVDIPTGLIAALLVAINSFVVRYAQEARGYTLALFLSCAATYLLVRALQEGSLRWWLAWGTIGGLSAYAHFFSGLVVMAHLVAIVAAARRAGFEWRRAGAGVSIALLLGAPLIAFVAWRTEGQISWIEEPSLGDLPLAVADLSGGGAVLAVLYVLLGVYALLKERNDEMDYGRHQRRWILLSWFLVPLLVSFFLSYVKPVFLPKYVIVALPALLLLAAKGVRDLSARPLQALALALVVALAGLTLITRNTRYFDQGSGEPWREAVAYVLDGARTGDAMILFSSRIWNPVNYYVTSSPEREKEAPELVYPRTNWGTAVPQNTPPVVSEIITQAAGYDRVWLVLGYAGGNRAVTAEAINRGLQDRFDKTKLERLRRIRIVLYE